MVKPDEIKTKIKSAAEVVPPPDWLVPGVLVNYYAIPDPSVPKQIPALRRVRVLSAPTYPGGRDWLVQIERKGRPVPTWTLKRLSEGPDTTRDRDAEFPSCPASDPAAPGGRPA